MRPSTPHEIDCPNFYRKWLSSHTTVCEVVEMIYTVFQIKTHPIWLAFRWFRSIWNSFGAVIKIFIHIFIKWSGSDWRKLFSGGSRHNIYEPIHHLWAASTKVVHFIYLVDAVGGVSHTHIPEMGNFDQQTTTSMVTIHHKLLMLVWELINFTPYGDSDRHMRTSFVCSAKPHLDTDTTNNIFCSRCWKRFEGKTNERHKELGNHSKKKFVFMKSTMVDVTATVHLVDSRTSKHLHFLILWFLIFFCSSRCVHSFIFFSNFSTPMSFVKSLK